MGTKPSISIKQGQDIIVRNIYNSIVYKDDYTPILIEGPAGVGKTEMVKQSRDILQERLGEKVGLFDFRAGQRTAQDLYGVPFPMQSNKGDKFVTFLHEVVLPGIIKSQTTKYGIFFIDELTTTTDEPLIAGLLQLMTDGEIAGYKLPEGWFVVAAANRKQDGNIFRPLPFPLRNRMQIFDVEFSMSGWLRYMDEVNISPMIKTYIKQTTDRKIIFSYDPEKEMDMMDMDESNYVCATPRAWFAVDRKIKAYEREEGNAGTPTSAFPSEQLRLEISSLIGEDIGGSFYNFYISNRDMKAETVTLDEILRGDDLSTKSMEYLKPTEILFESLKQEITDYGSWDGKISSKSPEKLKEILNIVKYFSYNAVPASGVLTISNAFSGELRNYISEKAKEDIQLLSGFTKLGESNADISKGINMQEEALDWESK